MSNPPPGLGGSGGGALGALGALRGPPPGFGSPSSTGSRNSTGGGGGGSVGSTGGGGGGGGGGGDGQGGTATIVRAQIVFLLSSMTEESFDKQLGEIRVLSSTNGSEMYHHFLRRAVVNANQVLPTLIQHYQQYQDDPAAPPPNVPSTGNAALPWRLLCSEAMRAARDITLAPHFASIMLSPSPSTPLPLPSLRMFNLPPAYLFSLSAYTIATPQIFPSTHPSIDSIYAILRQAFAATMDLLRSPGIPFWTTHSNQEQNQLSDDLSLQEARTLILALYPRSPPHDETSSRPSTPTNPTPPHSSPLSSAERSLLLSSLTIKFSSPAIVLQTLSALSPGGPPRSPGSLPLEDILFELGESLTQDEGTVEAVIRRWWGPYLLSIDDQDQNQLVTVEAANTVDGLIEGMRDGRHVDLHGVVKGLCSIPSISFPDLIRCFDTERSIAAYTSAIPLLICLFLIPPQTPVPPIAGLLPADLDAPIWSNLPSLLAVLQNLTSLPPDQFPLFTVPTAPPPSVYARIIDPPSNDSIMSKAARQAARDIQGAGLWNTLGLIRVLVEACAVADAEPQSEEAAELGRQAMSMLDKAAQLAPELVLIALEQLPKPLPPPLPNMHTRLSGMYLSTPPANITSSQLVFHQLKQLSEENLLALLLEFYQEDENNLGRVLDIGLEVKVLDKLLASDNLHFSLDVAAHASNKEYLNLEQWLADGIEVKGPDFLQGIFDFVEHKIRLEIDHQHQPESVPTLQYTLGTDVYSIFIRVIRNASELSKEDISRFRHLRTDILIIHPRLLNLRPNSKEEQGFSAAKYSKTVTDHVDDMYQRMYAGDLKLDDVVSELKRMLKSDDTKEHEIFACAVHALFDEHKFIKTYPAKELTMTGILFGAIIDYRLVKDTPAFVATRYVLDACKTAPHEALYQFGINALSVLRASLVDFPGLCRSLLEIPALHESHPVLINDIMAALAEREDLDQQGGVKLAFPALKLPILVEEGVDEFKEPDAKKKDAIMFIINQIAPSNYEAKSQELLNVFEDQYSRWFAHYFIDVRVSLESNRHEIYLQLIEMLKSPTLERHVLWETYRKARDLVNSEATIQSAAERTTLKTIALWLGRITLARNMPIKLRELSLKDLLIQGYDNKRLIVAIPFVCNLLAFCRESTVFHLPNPWLKSIMQLLVEFYHYAELRLNLKFEIEVLCGKLEVSLQSIEPSNLLRTHVPPPPPQDEVPDRLDQEYHRATAEIVSGSQRFEPPVDPAFARMQAFQSEQAAQAAQDAFMRRVDELIAALPESLVFSPEYPIFTAPTLQRVVHHSIDRAIRDIVNPVVERSVTIAGISSRDLIQKDFGMEGDASKMRHSAHLMVQNLAGNLALVTCKETLRTSMTNNIRSLLSQNGYTDDNMPEAMVAGVVNENLEPACNVIKTAAMEKAIKDIDVNLAPQYAARRAHREAGSRQPFWDGASFGVALSHATLPDPLRLHNGGLSTSQIRVYEDFAEPPKVFSSTNGDYYGQQDHADHKRVQSPFYPEATAAQLASPRNLSPQESLEKFHELVAEIEHFVSQTAYASLAELPHDTEIRSLIQGITYTASHASSKEQTTLIIAQRVVQLLYKTNSPFGMELYVVLLQQLCELSRKVEKEVKHWLIYVEDPRKFKVPVTVTLIRASFIDVHELDGQLSKMMKRSFDPDVLDFVAELVRECTMADDPIVSRGAFAACVAVFLTAREHRRTTQTVDKLLTDMRGPVRIDEDVQRADEMLSKSSIDPKLQERLSLYFLEWVRIYRTGARPEESFVPYISHLQKEGILNGEDVSSAFYRTAINCAADLDSAKGESAQHFYGTDALAKLIILIVKNYGDKSENSSKGSKVYYYNKILTIMAYSLVQRQLDESFSQRPWTRFFTSMLSELLTLQATYPDTYLGCIKSFANVLGITQPTYVPLFAFGWISLLSHRLFMPALLVSPVPEGWVEYHKCLMWLFRFLGPFCDSDEMSGPSRSLYQATLRLLLILLHDFPGFLAENYHSLTTAIPAHCVQLRNIVLSAFPPTDTPLPDWYARLDNLVGTMQRFPQVRADSLAALSTGNVRAAIDQHVRNGMPPSSVLVAELRNRIVVKTVTNGGETMVKYDNTLLHAAVFYLGTNAVSRKAQQSGHVEFDSKMAEVLLLTNLAFALDPEGQYLMLSVIADQLRYPSAHTMFFSYFILFLFATSARTDVENSIPERIARVLLERIIVHRPHPWGLLVTFIELLNNNSYGFWQQPCIREEEDIFLLFHQARRSLTAERPEGDVAR